jgi:hypothetical protein
MWPARDYHGDGEEIICYGHYLYDKAVMRRSQAVRQAKGGILLRRSRMIVGVFGEQALSLGDGDQAVLGTDERDRRLTSAE